MPFLVGQTVGDYVVVRAADHNAASEVYIVEHTITRRREAMWILGREGHCAAEDAEKLFAEIRHHARLSHPNIVGVHNAFWAGDALVMICELVEGGSLQTALERGPLPLNRSLDIMAGVLSAQAYAHANGVRQCALSPGRIFLARDGDVKLLNFGLSSPGGQPAAARTSTALNADAGDDRVANEQDDLYLCGVLFYELVTGSKPASHSHFPDFLETRCEESVLRWAGANRKLAVELSKTIRQAVAAETKARFPSAAAFREAVLRLRETSRAAAAHRPRVHHPRIVIGLAAAGFACALILVAANVTTTAPPAPRAQQTARREAPRLAAPVPAPLPAPPAKLASSTPSQTPPPPAKGTHPTRKRKNPIVRLAGAIKRLNPIGRRNDNETAQTQVTANSAPLPVPAKPAPRSR